LAHRIAIDEDYAAENADIIDAGLAMALGKEDAMPFTFRCSFDEMSIRTQDMRRA
jgi:hypothetical protein